MKFKIINSSTMENIEHLAEDLYKFAEKQLGFDKPAIVQFESTGERAKQVFAPTANYNPQTHAVTVFVDHRHPKDILRSMAHELVHHTQNCRGEFGDSVNTSPGYAQSDGHMRMMEEEAYNKGNVMLFRDWEDNYKKRKNIMSEGKKELVGKQKNIAKAAEPEDEITAADFAALKKSKKEKEMSEQAQTVDVAEEKEEVTEETETLEEVAEETSEELEEEKEVEEVQTEEATNTGTHANLKEWYNLELNKALLKRFIKK